MSIKPLHVALKQALQAIVVWVVLPRSIFLDVIALVDSYGYDTIRQCPYQLKQLVGEGLIGPWVAQDCEWTLLPHYFSPMKDHRSFYGMAEMPGFQLIEAGLDFSVVQGYCRDDAGERQEPDVVIRARAFKIGVADFVNKEASLHGEEHQIFYRAA